MPTPDARTALIDTALVELAQVVPSFGARAIARKAKVNHGLIPYYFKDAQGLLLTSIEEATREYLKAFEDLVERDADLLDQKDADRIATMVSWALDAIQNDPDHFARKRNICCLAADNEDVARHARDLIVKEIALTRRFVALFHGRDASLHSDETAAQVLIALFDGIAAQAAVGVGIDPACVEAAVRQILEPLKVASAE